VPQIFSLKWFCDVSDSLPTLKIFNVTVGRETLQPASKDRVHFPVWSGSLLGLLVRMVLD